jgi:putative ABC transport system substrate-binding protein
MKRRDFITLLGGATVAWPLAARAQQPAMPVVGLIQSGTPEGSGYRMAAFRQGLNESGYIEGHNVTIETRWAEGRYDSMPDIVADLVRRGVAVIATPGSTAAAIAAKAVTTAVPIVFGVNADPVKLGLVASLARPGGNATGVNFFTAEISAKRLELLRQMVPRVRRVAILVNPANVANIQTTSREVEMAGQALGVPTHVLKASNRREIDAAFATLDDERDALFVAGDGFFTSRRVQLALTAARRGIAATYASREYAEAGGLMSYGTNFTDMYHQVGAYAGRILRGARPMDLPVVQATKFELVINLQAATVLRLDVPASLLSIADEVIE